MKEDTKKLLVFCAHEQAETEHELSIDGSGEIVLTCMTETGTDEAPMVCGRFLKFPRGTGPEELKKLLLAHRSVNVGQVSTASVEEEKAKLLADLTDEQV